MAKSASASALSAQIGYALAARLEQHQTLITQSPTPALLTWSELLQSLPQPHQELARQALAKPPAKTAVVVAIPDDADSPVSLTSDIQQLAESRQLLQRLVLHPLHGCSINHPVRPLPDLVKSLDKRLQKQTLTAWSEDSRTPPAGIAVVRTTKGKKSHVSFHDTRFPRPETQLASQLLSALRRTPDHSRPVTAFAELLALAGISPDNPFLPAALALPELKTAIQTLRGSGLEAWICDSERLILTLGNPLLLARLLTETCSPASPEIRLSALAKLLSKDVQPGFVNAWLQPGAAQLLTTICHSTPAGTPRKPDLLLRDLRFPSPEKTISERLIQALHKARADGGTLYPLRWSALQQLVTTDVPRQILHKATQVEPFLSSATIACPNAPDSPVFLTDDLSSCVRSPAMLTFLVRRGTTDDNVAMAPQKLAAAAGLSVAVKPQLEIVAEEIIAGAVLPAGIGLGRIARKWQLLDLSRIRHSTSVAVQPPATNSTSESPQVTASAEAFAAALDAAFTELSQTSHLPGYVSLADLRPALSEYPRDVFDEHLLRLRRAGLYSLSLLEGRMALNAAEEAAVIQIDNRGYLLVQRRSPGAPTKGTQPG
ncbi:MAG: hypothetical protein ACKO2P_18645 [Planctomycetota bacterium]